MVKPNSNDFKCKESIWKNLQDYWRQKRERESAYEPLAKLFEGLEEYDLAAYFSQVSYGKVPIDLFNKAFSKTKSKNWNPESFRWSQNILGLEVVRERNLKDYTRILNKYALPIALIGFLLVTHLGSFVGGYMLGKAESKGKEDSTTNKNPNKNHEPDKSTSAQASATNSPTATTTPNDNQPLSANEKKGFDKKTKPALQQITNDLLGDRDLIELGLSEDSIKKAIKESLGAQDVNYAGAIEQKNETQIKMLVNAISSYQKSNIIDVDGIIEPKKNTFKKLKKEVKAKLKANPQNYKG